MPKKTKTKRLHAPSGQTVTCDLCGETHGLMTGTWVINGEGDLLCYGYGKNCVATRVAQSERCADSST